MCRKTDNFYLIRCLFIPELNSIITSQYSILKGKNLRRSVVKWPQVAGSSGLNSLFCVLKEERMIFAKDKYVHCRGGARREY